LDAIISVRGLTHVYSPNTPFEQVAIKDINLDIYKGEIIGVIGHTGSGKSTLISHLNGLIKPAAGTVTFNGENIWKSKEFTHSIRFKVGLVFQYPEYQLFEETVYRDIAFGPTNMGLKEDEIRGRVADAIRFVGLKPDILEKSPFSLSGGQKRRVAIAGVIAMMPDVLILDEPTAGLDPRGRADIINHVKAYNKSTGLSVVLVTHNMEDIAQTVDRIIVLKKGEIMMTGGTSEVFSRGKELEAAGLAVPQITQVANRLFDAGLNISTSVYTVEQLKNELLSLGGARK
jgi:energy-coupling factor transport system ATP-binding protein